MNPGIETDYRNFRLRDSIRNRRYEESRRIYTSLVRSVCFLVPGIMLLFYPGTFDNLLLCAVGITAVIVSLVVIALNIVLMLGLKRNDSSQPLVTDDVSDALLYSEKRLPAVKLETQDGNQIRIGIFELEQWQWRKLHDSLRDAEWYWIRDNIDDAKVIKNLTAPGVFSKLTDDWRTLRILDGRYVNARGRAALREAGGITLIT